MLTQYCLTLQPDRPCTPQPEWAYHLYAALLEQAPSAFGAQAHRDAVTPVSQFLSVKNGVLLWTVSLLGEDSEAALSETLERMDRIFLHKERAELRVCGTRRRHLRNVDELFTSAPTGVHRLRFRTATAFKSQGQYLNLPTSRLIVQSLLHKWNGSILECPIEDADGQGMETLSAGLRCREFRLQSQTYHIKGRPIPGFTGTITLENQLTGFHRQLADALLLFASYSGVGIKTTLGLGGVEHS
jgi:CRISPR-associated endoribonuclease Cas6